MKPLVSYFLLAFLFSWILWSPIVLWFPDRSDPPLWVLSLAFLGAYGPSAAAIVTALLFGGRRELRALLDGIRRGTRIRWYFLACLVPPAFIWIGACVAFTAGAAAPAIRWEGFVRALIIFGTFVPIGPLGEELGWRGYALPRLDSRMNRLVSSMLLGCIWVLWHAPILWLPGAGLPYGAARTLPVIAMWALNVLSFSILLGFAAWRTNYNVRIAILLHASLNAASAMGFAPLAVGRADAAAVREWSSALRWAIVTAAAVTLAGAGRATRPKNYS